MKKIIAFIAIVVLTSSFLLADPPAGNQSQVVTPDCATPVATNNIASLAITCPTMTFACHGPAAIGLVAGDPVAKSCSTQWDINYWGDHGTFIEQSPTPYIYTVTSFPAGGAATDIVITPGTWSRSNVGLNGGDPHYKFLNSHPTCNATGTCTYTCQVKAIASAIQGTYVITFEQDFAAE
jgi:hypothetical protein